MIFSKKIRKIAHIDQIVGNEAEGAVIGWGHKPTADRAREYAKKHHLSYVALEDGFLRSLGLGCCGADPLSLVLDRSGIYYDAAMPSDLETMLQQGGGESPELLGEARRAIAEIRRHCLSKYNAAPKAPRLLGEADAAHPRVLIIDQTAGDSSVELGMASAMSFEDMLVVAKMVYPTGRFFVKTHPDVLAGKKKGYLTEAAKLGGAELIADDVAPLSLLEQADVVFCVTSQMGFEALLLGLPVHCFGMPFYAGWGLTYDAVTCPRRTRRRTVEEVFAAAYMLYPRYIDPIRGVRTDIHSTIRRLAEQRRFNEANRGYHACFGYSRWKHPHARAFLQSSGAAFGFFKYFHAEKRAVKAAREHGGDVVVWSSKCTPELEALCLKNEVPLVRMEDGFIRSVGLGSNFERPYSLVLDRQGIYYDPQQPSDLEGILNTLPQRVDHNDLCARARALRETIVTAGLTKYNLDGTRPERSQWQASRVILVPGQVEDDASVRRGGLGIQGNFALLRRVRRLNPDAYVLYKPHPDVEVRNRKGRIADSDALKFADEVVRNVRMDALLGAVDEVHTLTSLTGFEALLRGVRVTTYGGPFYAGWGLTTDRARRDSSFYARRSARLTLDELVAGVLLLYPAYYDWETKSFCSAEDVCWRLQHPTPQKKGVLGVFARVRERVRRYV